MSWSVVVKGLVGEVEVVVCFVGEAGSAPARPRLGRSAVDHKAQVEFISGQLAQPPARLAIYPLFLPVYGVRLPG